MSQRQAKKLRKKVGFDYKATRTYAVTEFNNGTHTFRAVKDREAYQDAKKEKYG